MKFPSSMHRFIRFGLVGGMGVVVNFGCYVILHDRLGFYDLVAQPLAFELSVVNNFLWNAHWTFRDRGRRDSGGYLLQFISFAGASTMVGGVVQFANQYVQTRHFGVWDKLALLIGIGLGALANYFICNRLIFRHRSASPTP